MQAVEVLVVLVMAAVSVAAMVLLVRWGAGVDARRARGGAGGNTARLLQAERCGNTGCREVVREGARYCTRCGGRVGVGEKRVEG